MEKGAEIILRIKEAMRLIRDKELADYLGIRPPTLSSYHKKDHVPADWLIKIQEEKGINATWLKTGQGRRFVEVEDDLSTRPDEAPLKSISHTDLESGFAGVVKKFTGQTYKVTITKMEGIGHGVLDGQRLEIEIALSGTTETIDRTRYPTAVREDAASKTQEPLKGE